MPVVITGWRVISNLSWIDNFILLGYFGLVLLVGIYYTRIRDNNPSDYFLASRGLGWITIGISLFVTNISSEHIIGLAGASSKSGFAAGQLEWLAVIVLIVLGWMLAPVFIKSGVLTVPQFFGERFDARTRNYLTWVSIFAYLTIKISVTLLAGGMLLSGVLGWNMLTSAVILVAITGIYTMMGGLKAVVNTQLIQAGFLLLGAILLVVYGIHAVGGLGAFSTKIPPQFTNVFRPVSDPDFPWTGMLLGAPVLAVWYWCTDQYIMQRILGAKSVDDARKGTLLTAALKTLPIFLFLIPGIVAVILFPEIEGDKAYAHLLSGTILPTGVKGIVIAGVFAAMMSSLASAFNSAAALVTNDLYKPRRPDASDNELVMVGRVVTAVMVIFAIICIPLIKLLSGQIYVMLQSTQAYISPPIVAVFLLGLFWKGATSRGAVFGLAIGGFLGFSRLIIDITGAQNLIAYEPYTFFATVNYLHFAGFLFLFSGLTVIVFSHSKAMELSESKRATYMFSMERSELPAVLAKMNRMTLKSLLLLALALTAAGVITVFG